MEKKDPKFPNKYLIIGTAFLIIGFLLLLWTNDLLPGFSTLWPVPVILGGMTLLYLAFLRQKNSILILPGMFLALAGILFLLLNTVLSRSKIALIWPAFMLITGISLLPYGFKKREKYRVRIIIPAIAIILLSLIFLPFSLGISPISFTDFITLWWPAIFVITGLFLISSFAYQKKSGSRRQKHDKK